MAVKREEIAVSRRRGLDEIEKRYRSEQGVLLADERETVARPKKKKRLRDRDRGIARSDRREEN